MQKNLVKLVSLPTLDQLEKFWAEHKGDLPYAGQCMHSSDESLYTGWFFGSTKLAVVDAVLQWDRWHVCCTWRKADEDEYAWANIDPSHNFGFWEFSNLPFKLQHNEWFEPPFDFSDPNLSCERVIEIFKEKTFDAWDAGSASPACFFDAQGIENEITYWQKERAAGEDYYGSENESQTSP